MRKEINDRLLKKINKDGIFSSFSSEFVIPSEKQIESFSFKDEIGSRAAITDYAILMGGEVSKKLINNYSNNTRINVLKDRIGSYYVDSKNKSTFFGGKISYKTSYCIDDSQYKYSKKVPAGVGIRPVIEIDFINELNEEDFIEITKNKNEIVEFGAYPQYVATNQKLLNELYDNNRLETTGFSYYFGNQLMFEYKYGDNYFVKIKLNKKVDNYLSDNKIYDDDLWLKVSPVRWIVDKKNKLLVSEKILFTNVDKLSDEVTDNFNSFLNNILKTRFEKRLIQHVELIDKNNALDNYKVFDNIYNFDYSNVSEEDIIRGAINSDISVFLHGKSSDGKSARVKQIDPNLEIIYLRNATVQSLNGIEVYNDVTGKVKSIPPTWYKRLVEKCCADRDNIHIVFFDELSNATSQIQAMAFNIILDKEINGKWKLPENARIVASGNETVDSLSAYDLAEPLYSRFAHVYINTTIDSWTKWALTKDKDYKNIAYKKDNKNNNIHPAILAYISYKDWMGENVLRQNFDGVNPSPDPRKWEMASKLLYNTNKPEMLRSLVGRGITDDFIKFTKVIDNNMEEIILNKYKEARIEQEADLVKYKK